MYNRFYLYNILTILSNQYIFINKYVFWKHWLGLVLTFKISLQSLNIFHSKTFGLKMVQTCTIIVQPLNVLQYTTFDTPHCKQKRFLNPPLSLKRLLILLNDL